MDIDKERILLEKENISTEQQLLIDEIREVVNQIIDSQTESKISGESLLFVLDQIDSLEKHLSDCDCKGIIEYKEEVNSKVETLEKRIREKKERIISLNEREDKLVYQLNHCPLTKILNRYSFNQKFDSLIEEYNVNKKDFTFAILDLDHFKQINDKYWHPHWDKVLKLIAFLINKELDDFSSINIYRIGWEEFAILWDDKITKTIIRDLLVKILDFLRERTIRVKWEEKFKHHLSFSAGVISFIWKNEEQKILFPNKAYNQVDSLMYTVKETTRNRVEYKEV